MEEILRHTKEYLAHTLPDFQTKGKFFTCPTCKQVKCLFIFNSGYRMFCHSCKRTIGNICDVLNPENPDAVLQDIVTTLNLNMVLPTESNDILATYETNGFDLVPLVKDLKIPTEKDWLNKEHKSITEWKHWLANGLNIGVKTGKKSNLTVIDIDTATIPEEIKQVMGEVVIQKTPRGWGLFYLYTDLPTTRIDELKIDILNDGKQCLLTPSITDGQKREFTTSFALKEMPSELKILLEDKLTLPNLKSFSEKLD